MSEQKKPKKKQKSKKTKKVKTVGCKHDYAYCYYNHKEHENVYRCVNCGRWLYQ